MKRRLSHWRQASTLVAVLVLLLASLVLAQVQAQDAQPSEDQPEAPAVLSDPAARNAQRLQTLADRKQELTAQKEQFLSQRGDDINDLNPADTRQLQTLDAEIDQVTESFELIALGTVDVSDFDEQEAAPFNWQQELSDIAAPIIESVKGLTQKSQQMTNLRKTITRYTNQKKTAEQAIAAIEQSAQLPVTDSVIQQLNSAADEWQFQLQSVDDKLTASEARLELLQQTEVPLSSRIRSGIRSFFLGRGLTLLLAILAAGVAYFFMRGVWWLVANKVVKKDVRRKATWFRMVSYTFVLYTGIVMFIAFIAVLNLREDTLLLAIALVLIIAAALGLRNFLPGYIQETKLLLNIGPVREEERVILNGLPWNVESLNLQTVLRNPALNGVLRLPIAEVKQLTSRPYRDKLWFPTNKGDFIILPDETFAEVVEQTPELIQLKIHGGMVKSVPTAEFFAMQIVNLSRGPTFGIKERFGLDYSIQSESLDRIPDTLKKVVQQALLDLGQQQASDTLTVELEKAGDSSLDFLVFARIPSKHAQDYPKLGRAITQACVKACNENGWSIPFPQMVMHRAPHSKG